MSEAAATGWGLWDGLAASEGVLGTAFLQKSRSPPFTHSRKGVQGTLMALQWQLQQCKDAPGTSPGATQLSS